jgi:hypothetical protein
MAEVALMNMVAESISRVERKIDAQATDNAESRRRMHERQEAMNLKLVTLEHDMSQIKGELTGMRPTVAEFVTMRNQAAGAGRLGRFMWKLASYSIAAASGAAGFYAWISGFFTRG